MSDNAGPGFEEFLERFSQLGEEAKQYGVSYLVLLTGYDPLGSDSRCFHTWDGNFYELTGALKVLLNELEQSCSTRRVD